MSTGAFASISPVTASQRCSAARACRRLASSIRSQVRRMLPSLTRGAARLLEAEGAGDGGRGQQTLGDQALTEARRGHAPDSLLLRGPIAGRADLFPA